MVDQSLIVLGDFRVVRWMRYKNAYPARDYVDELEGAVQARFLAICSQIAERRVLPDATNAHALKRPFESLYELKSFAHRIIGFWQGNTLYLAAGAPKRKAKEQNSDYARAELLRIDFIKREEAKEKDGA